MIYLKINCIQAVNFKGFETVDIQLAGKSTAFFGINGTGKSTVLSVVNYAFWNWISRLNSAQGTAYKSINSELVHVGAGSLQIAVDVTIGDTAFTLKKSYSKPRTGKPASTTLDKKSYDAFVDAFMRWYLADGKNMPIFVNYGTNRSVLDIPLRIRNKHQFSKLTALERCIENELDFRTFFEWFRNQEDYENEKKTETGRLDYEDPALRCVRTALKTMLDGVSSPRVRRNPLRMVVKKGNAEFYVDQLSDGEKCTLALLGDLARRIALANPFKENPLEGDGIVLIDEIELHMHPQWQRRILGVLRTVFPNIQFIVTTHSPQVLSELDDSYNIFQLNRENGTNHVARIERLDGFDTSYILEEYMDTRAKNPSFLALLENTYRSIADGRFDDAQKGIDRIAQISTCNSADLIQAEGALKRGRIMYEKNHKG